MFQGSLGSALLDSARRHADRPALRAQTSALTYRELFERALAIAGVLVSNGIGPNERVAVLAQRTATIYCGLLAALLAGCTYVPLNTRFPKDRNIGILRASGAAALILDDHSAKALRGSGSDLSNELLVITPESEAASFSASIRSVGRSQLPHISLEGGAVPETGSSDTFAYLMFTSGTTGAPKGVPISHGNLAAYFNALTAMIEIGPDDRLLQAVDLTFDLSAHDMFGAWLNGAELYSVPENAVILTPRIIAQYGITNCLLVPSTAARAAEQGLLKPGGMPSLRHSLFCGEALPVSVARAWNTAASNAKLYNFYGPTEATIQISCFPFDPDQKLDFPIVPIGWQIEGSRVDVLDDAGKPVPDGESGEILLAGPQLTRGYWNAPHLDAEKFVTHGGTRWYRTGDLGRRDPTYGIVFGGRADRQVKIRGYRVELQEIEGILRRLTGRERVAVVAWPLLTEAGNADGCAAFICGGDIDAAALRTACRDAMPPYMIPVQIISLDELPLNANGKTDYGALQRHPQLTGPTDRATKPAG